MNLLKRFLFKILGVKVYLSVISRLFFLSYDLNFLKGNRTFDCHYIVENLITKGDTVIDLGANLGYYSVIFSKLVGKNGQVYSIEPVQLFRSVFAKNTRSRKNIEILPYAIGPDDEKKIKMGVPKTTAYFSHGRTRILNEKEDCLMFFDATMKRPDKLFSSLNRLDYLKCDIEGFENIAIPLFDKLLKKYKPTLQIEMSNKNKEQLVHYLRELEYTVFGVEGKNIYTIPSSAANVFGDLIFISNEKIDNYQHLIAAQTPHLLNLKVN